MKTEHILLGITGAVLIGGVLLYVRSRQTSPTPVNSGGGTNPITTKPVINNPILKFPTVSTPVFTKPVITNPILPASTTKERIFPSNTGSDTLLDERGLFYGINPNILR